MIPLGSETLAVAWELWPPGLLEQAARLVTIIRVANELFMETHLAADPSISVSKAKQSNRRAEYHLHSVCENGKRTMLHYIKFLHWQPTVIDLKSYG